MFAMLFYVLQSKKVTYFVRKESQFQNLKLSDINVAWTF